jgi:hypothetical protein
MPTPDPITNQNPQLESTQQESSTTSPLWEADPNSLDKIFDAIDKKLALNLPREITDFEIERVVDYYLRGRETFMRELAEGKQPSRKPAGSSGTTGSSKAKKALQNLDL